MFWLILIALFVSGVIWKIKHIQSYWQRKGVKHIPPTFLGGNIKLIPTKSMYEQVHKIYNEFPDERYYGIYQFLTPTLLIKDLEVLKQITVKDFDTFMNHRSAVDAKHDPLCGRNLFAAKGETWRSLRVTMSPAFTSSKMRLMYELMEECALQFVSHLREHEEGDVQEWEVRDIFSRYTNDVIASAAFGLKCDSLRETKNTFYLMGKKATKMGIVVMLKFFLGCASPWLSSVLRVKIVPEDCAKYFYDLIADTVRTREEKNIVRPDMIHLLMQARKKKLEADPNNTEMDITDITAQAFFFFFAGFDTVSTVISFLFYELALNPSIQAVLRKEIQEVWDEKGKISYEDLLAMKYMDKVMNEGLRKWPPAPISDRQSVRPYTIHPTRPGEKELHLEAGQAVWFSALGIHRDPRYYPDPMKFDPERFSEENRRDVDPYTFLPFGAGPRNCIGSRFALLEMKLLIFHVLKEYETVPTKRTRLVPVLDSFQGTPAIKGGTWLGFKRVKS